MMARRLSLVVCKIPTTLPTDAAKTQFLIPVRNVGSTTLATVNDMKKMFADTAGLGMDVEW
jgi:hypothetical protein